MSDETTTDNIVHLAFRRGAPATPPAFDGRPLTPFSSPDRIRGRTAARVEAADAPRPPREMFAQLDRYWTELRGDRVMPRRAEVDPRGLTGMLDKVFLVERVAPGVARFRLAGAHLTALAGAELRGMPMTVLFTPDARPEISRAVECVFSDPAVIDMTLDGARSLMSRHPVTARMALYPLRGDDGEANRAIGCLVSTREKSGRAPQRFRVAASAHRGLTGWGDDRAGADRPVAYPAGPADLPEVVSPDSPARFHPVAADLPDGPPARPRGKPTLTLVVSTD